MFIHSYAKTFRYISQKTLSPLYKITSIITPPPPKIKTFFSNIFCFFIYANACFVRFVNKKQPFSLVLKTAVSLFHYYILMYYCLYPCSMLKYSMRTTVLQGGLTSHFFQNGGDAYEKSF